MLQETLADRNRLALFVLHLFVPGKVQRVEELLHELRVILGENPHRIPHLIPEARVGQRKLVVSSLLLRTFHIQLPIHEKCGRKRIFARVKKWWRQRWHKIVENIVWASSGSRGNVSECRRVGRVSARVTVT